MSILRRTTVSRVMLLVLALLLLALPAAPGTGRAQPSQPPVPQVGAIVTMAIDNAGSGWAWAGPAGVGGGSGTLLRLDSGRWVPASGSAAGALSGAAAVDKIALLSTAGEGWAIGTGGGPQVWRLSGGTWARARNPFTRDTVLKTMSVSADGTDGWITGSDLNTFEYVLFRLRDGQWVRTEQPQSAPLKEVAISPDGRQAWGIGESREGGNAAMRLTGGSWVEVEGDVPQTSVLGRIVADNLGNGWVVGPHYKLESGDAVLTRLTPGGVYTVSPDWALPSNGWPPDTFAVHDIAVDGNGRGWATGAGETPGDLPGGGTFVQYVQLRLDGDTVLETTDDVVEPTPEATLNLSPVAISPDGAHARVAVSSDEFRLVAMAELAEPWSHDAPVAAVPLQGPGRCFIEVPNCLRGVFARFWEANGGLEQLGFPITPEVMEEHGGTTYTVQYTQRARLEYHPENRPPNDVLLGLLGNTLVESRLEEGPFRPVGVSGARGTRWFRETGHNVGAPFIDYWTNRGGLRVFGLPRSEAFEEKSSTDGKTYLVQYFERNRLEHHPEHRGTPAEILLGLLGVEQFTRTYGFTP